MLDHIKLDFICKLDVSKKCGTMIPMANAKPHIIVIVSGVSSPSENKGEKNKPLEM